MSKTEELEKCPSCKDTENNDIRFSFGKGYIDCKCTKCGFGFEKDCGNKIPSLSEVINQWNCTVVSIKGKHG